MKEKNKIMDEITKNKIFSHTLDAINKIETMFERFHNGDQTPEDEHLIENLSLEIAKGLLYDGDKWAVQIAKIILAINDIGKIKVKIE